MVGCCGWAKPASFGAGFVLGVHENCPGRVGESSRLKPLLQGVEALAVAFDLAIRGPSEAAEPADQTRRAPHMDRSEEHTSELQSLMRISYAVFCLKKKNKK